MVNQNEKQLREDMELAERIIETRDVDALVELMRKRDELTRQLRDLKTELEKVKDNG